MQYTFAVTQEELLAAALRLPEEARKALAHALFDSVYDPPPGPDFSTEVGLRELERRAVDPSPGTPWDEVKARVLSRLAK
jgi:putative addiction module component (TIGR02574 family)